MKLRRITESQADKIALNDMNVEAFPKEERIPTPVLIQMARDKVIDLFLATENNVIIGFFVTFPKNNCAYLFYFAIEKTQRGKGYGTKMLHLLRQTYKGYHIVLDMEVVDENADNYQQRVSRKSFYITNGMNETGYFISYMGMTFELLCSDTPFQKENFQTVLNHIVEHANQSGRTVFNPVIHPKNMKTVNIGNDAFEELYAENIVAEQVSQSAKTIAAHFTKKELQENVVFLILANGGNWFAERLLSKYDFPIHSEYALIKSYEDNAQSEINVISIPSDACFSGKSVIVIDDILDSGKTMQWVLQHLGKCGAKEACCAVLCKREGNPMQTINAPLIVSGNAWIAGCGMDTNHKGRNLQAIYKKL